MTAIVELKDATVKVNNGFDTEKIILDHVNLTIREGDFITILGGNGAGKSTLFNVIAGTLMLTSGQIFIMGEEVTALPAEKRAKHLSRVFQDPKMGTAPRMTVAENLLIAKYRGEKRGLKSRQIHLYTEEFQGLIERISNGLEKHLDTPAGLLSGGQRQRVAIGNAIIREPKVLLMDEPLSNLDAKLRTQMRVELAGIHKALGNTIIYVTHDQTEAMTLGDRIVVMNQGAVQQADTPQNLYAYPVNRFVAGFIGSPSMNFIKGLAMEKVGIPTFRTENDGDIPIPDFLWKILKRQGYVGRNIELGIRPEHFLEKPAEADTRGEWKMEVTVTARELLGAEVILHFNHDGQDCCAKVSGDSLLDKGDKVTLWIDMAYISAFDLETQENITLRKGMFS